MSESWIERPPTERALRDAMARDEEQMSRTRQRERAMRMLDVASRHVAEVRGSEAWTTALSIMKAAEAAQVEEEAAIMQGMLASPSLTPALEDAHRRCALARAKLEGMREVISAVESMILR